MLLAAGVSTKPNPDVPVPEPKYGAYIQDTTGKLWSAEEWDGSATPNGIAVRDRTYGPSEGILLAILSTLTKVYFNTKKISMPTTPDNLRNQDFDGEARSQSLLADVGISSLPAISECVSYVFPDGQNGYLGAFGEMRLIYDCLSEIKKCLSALGIEKDLFNNHIWTCTASEEYTTSSSLYIYSFKPSDLSIVLSLGGSLNSQGYVWPIGKVGDWSK
jgi:hypothetical protein